MITGLLRDAVRANPAKLAIIHGAQRIRYDDLADRVGRLASGLRGLGLGPGDCIAAVLPNCAEFVIAFLASAALQAIFLPLNPRYTKGELQRFITDGRARIILVGGAGLEICQDMALEMTTSIPIVAVAGGLAGTIPFAALGDGPLDLDGLERYAGRALYLYTSGSTDSYKRICCTQENLWFEAKNFIDTVGLTAADTILCTIPLYHSYGIGNCLLDALFLGATLVILEQSAAGQSGEPPFLDQCGQLAELMRREAVRFYPGVPHQFSVLAGLPSHFPIDFSPVRLCMSSGDVLPKRTCERFLARFGQPIRSLYGSTEAGSIAINLDSAEQLEFGSLGRPLRNVDVEIRNLDGRVLGAAQEGEIWVKSPTLPPSGYDNRPELTREMFRDGFYRTGDIGMVGQDGRLTMTGRKQSFVDIAGYKVDIGEVEEVLHDCPGVLEAAALGVTIEAMGTLIKAVVVAKDGWQAQQIRAFCRERLAFVKVPRLIELRAALPRASTGKVLKSELSDVTAYLDSIRDAATLQSVRQLAASLPGQRRRLIRTIVQAQAAAVLGLPPEEIPDEQGFSALGMDSFAAIELRARLEYLLDHELPETMTFDYPTVAAVVDFLLQLLASPRNRMHDCQGCMTR